VATDVAWIDVLPTGKNFLPNLDKIISSAMPGAGKRAGEQYGKAFSDSATAKIEQSSDRVAAAQKRAEDAAGRHSVALTRLQDLVNKGTASASQLAAANEGVARSARAVEAATDGVSRAQSNLERTHRQVKASVDEQGGSFGRLRGGMLGLELESRALDRTSQGLSRSVGILGTVGVAAFGALGSQALVGGVAALGGAAATASGAILLLPAAAVAVAAPLATFKLGLIGVDDAFKALNDGKMDKFEEALQKMAPSARATFREIATLKPAFDDLRQSIQQEMFSGLAAQIQPLANAYLPILRAEFGLFATAINRATLDVAGFLLQGNRVADVQIILTNVRAAFNEVTRAIEPALSIFTDLAVVGSEFVPGLSGGLADLAAKTAAWVTQARQTGVLRDIMSAALSVIGDLGLIVMNVGSIIVSVFQAGAGSGAGFLEIIRNATGELANFLNTDYGQSMLADAFAAIGAAIQAVMPLIGIVAGIVIGQLVPAFAGLGLQLAPIAQVLLVQLGYAIGQLTPILPLVGEAIIAIVNAFIPWIPLLAQAAVVLLPPFLGLITELAPLIVPLAGAIFVLVQATAAWNAIMTLASVAGGALRAIQAAIWITTTAWTAAQWLLNAAMAANPITLVIIALVALGAALVIAWNNSETFRSIVTAAWNGIKDAASFAWNSVIKPVIDAFAAAGLWLWNNALMPAFTGIKAAWDAVAAGVKWAYDNIIKPTWDFLLIAAQYLLAVLATLIFAPLLIAWNLMAAGWRLAYDNVIQPLWNLMQFAMDGLKAFFEMVWTGLRIAWEFLAAGWKIVYDNVILPLWRALQTAMDGLSIFVRGIWTGMQIAWQYLADWWSWVYNTKILPMWNALMDYLRYLWEARVRPIWDAMKAGWEILGNFFRWVYDRIIQPAWDAVAASLTWLKDRFNDAVNWIRDIWNGIKRVLAVPINFMINTVWNQGVVPAWNMIADLLPGVGRISNAKPIAEGNTGGQVGTSGGRATIDSYANGGQIKGWWRGPAADNILGVVDNQAPIKVNPLEWIHPVAAVKQYGGPFMRSVQTGQFPTELAQAGVRAPRRYGPNDKVRREDVRERYATGGQIPGFAQGSIIDLGRLLQSKGAKVTEHPAFGGVAPVHGKNSLHYSAQAIDVNTRSGESAAEQRELDPLAALARSMGFRVIWRSAGHFNHMHADTGKGLGSIGTASGSASTQSTIDEIFSSLKGQIADLFTSKARSFVDKYTWNEPPRFHGIPRKAGHFLIDKAVEWFTGKAQEKANAEGAATGASSLGVGTTNGPVQETVRAVASTRGWGTGAQWDALSWIVGKESGWRPGAQNPVSSASGLFQFIDSTWRAYRPKEAAGFAKMRLAPVNQQAVGGMNYFGGRYGSPVAARAFWQRNGWYAGGGQIPANLFDNGGLWRAGTLGFNAGGSGRGYRGRTDERVLTAPQDNTWRQFVRTGDAMLRELDARGGGSGRKIAETINVHAEGPDAALRAVDKLYRKIRMHDRGGVHSNVTTFST